MNNNIQKKITKYQYEINRAMQSQITIISIQKVHHGIRTVSMEETWRLFTVEFRDSLPFIRLRYFSHFLSHRASSLAHIVCTCMGSLMNWMKQSNTHSERRILTQWFVISYSFILLLKSNSEYNFFFILFQLNNQMKSFSQTLLDFCKNIQPLWIQSSVYFNDINIIANFQFSFGLNTISFVKFWFQWIYLILIRIFSVLGGTKSKFWNWNSYILSDSYNGRLVFLLLFWRLYQLKFW